MYSPEEARSIPCPNMSASSALVHPPSRPVVVVRPRRILWTKQRSEQVDDGPWPYEYFSNFPLIQSTWTSSPSTPATSSTTSRIVLWWILVAAYPSRTEAESQSPLRIVFFNGGYVMVHASKISPSLERTLLQKGLMLSDMRSWAALWRTSGCHSLTGPKFWAPSTPEQPWQKTTWHNGNMMMRKSSVLKKCQEQVKAPSSPG